MNDLKFVTHFTICTMENIIRKTVQDEVEKCLSPPSAKPSRKRSETRMANLLAKIRKRESPKESKLKKVHIKWKRFCIVRNAEYLVPQKKGGGLRFIHLALEATIEELKKKAIEVFFPDSVNHFGEKADECILTFTDAGLLDLDLLNSFEGEDFESNIVFHQPTNLGQSQVEFKD